MKFVIVFAALIAVAVAAPAGSDVTVTRQESDVQPESYKFGWETSDGSKHDSEGQLKEIGTDHETLNVRGTYSFVADDGKTYSISYIADENGFQPTGEHIPHAP